MNELQKGFIQFGAVFGGYVALVIVAFAAITGLLALFFS